MLNQQKGKSLNFPLYLARKSSEPITRKVNVFLADTKMRLIQSPGVAEIRRAVTRCVGTTRCCIFVHRSKEGTSFPVTSTPNLNMTQTTDWEYRNALSEVALIVLGRKVALKTKEVRNDPKALLDIAEQSIREDASVPIDDPDFQLKLKQVAHKLDAIESLRVLARALDEFAWET